MVGMIGVIAGLMCMLIISFVNLETGGLPLDCISDYLWVIGGILACFALIIIAVVLGSII